MHVTHTWKSTTVFVMQTHSFTRRRLSPAAICVAVLVATTSARADPASHEVAVHAGAQAPIFFVYEAPGPALAVNVARRIAGAASAEVAFTFGALFAPGLRRGTSVITAGLRYELAPPLLLRLGFGGAGYLEHVAIDLATRSVREIDRGGALVITTAVNVRLGERWCLDVRFDTNAVASRGMDFIGTAALMVGRRL